MTIKPKIDSRPPGGITEVLADEMWVNLGRGYPALVELQVVERTEPAFADDPSSVKLRIVSIEFAHDEPAEGALRKQLREMWEARRQREKEAARAQNGELPLDGLMDELEKQVNAGALDTDDMTVTIQRT